MHTNSPPSLRPAWLDVLRTVNHILEDNTEEGRSEPLRAVDRLRAVCADRHRYDYARGRDISASLCITVADEQGTAHLVGVLADAWCIDRSTSWNSIAALEAVIDIAPDSDGTSAGPDGVENESGNVRIRAAALLQWGGDALVIPCDTPNWHDHLRAALASVPAEAWTALGEPTPAAAP